MISNSSHGRWALASAFSLCLLCSSLSAEAGSWPRLHFRNNTASAFSGKHYYVYRTLYSGSWGSESYVLNNWTGNILPGGTEQIDMLNLDYGITKVRWRVTWDGGGTATLEATDNGSGGYTDWYMDIASEPVHWYLSLLVINNCPKAQSYTMNVGSQSAGVRSLAANSSISACLGPFDEPQAYSFGAIDNMDKMVAVGDGSFTTTVTNTVGTGGLTAGDGWTTNSSCAGVTPRVIVLCGSATGPTDWDAAPTNASNADPLTTGVYKTGVDSIKKSVDALGPKTDAINNNLSNLGGKLDTANGLLDNIADNTRETADGVGGITNRLGKLDYLTNLPIVASYASNAIYASTNSIGSNDFWKNVAGSMDIYNSARFAASNGAGQVLTALGAGVLGGAVGMGGGFIVGAIPGVGDDMPEAGDSFPGMHGARIGYTVPWSGGKPTSSSIAIKGWMAGFLKKWLGICLIIALAVEVYRESILSWRWLLTVPQIKMVNAIFLGSSVGIPFSLVLCGGLLAALMTAPAIITLAWTSIAASAVPTIAQTLSDMPNDGGSGVWGLVKLIVPWDLFWTCLLSYLSWLVIKDAATSALAGYVKGSFST